MALGSIPVQPGKRQAAAIEAALAASAGNPLASDEAFIARRARQAAARDAVRRRITGGSGGLVPVGPNGVAVNPGTSMVPVGPNGIAQQVIPGQVQQTVSPAMGAAGQVERATMGGPTQTALNAGRTIPTAATATADDLAGMAARAPAAATATAASPAALNAAAATVAPDPLVGNGLTGWRAFASRTPFQAGSQAATAFAPGTIGRAGLYGMGGQIAGGLFDSVVGEQDGTWDDATSSALRWGGAGAGIGSMIMPGVGTAVGAGVGALVGGVKGWLTGDDKPATEARHFLYGEDGMSGEMGKLNSTLDKYGIQGSMRDDLMMQLDIMGQRVGSREEAKALIDNTFAALPQLQAQAREDTRIQARSAALQSYLGPMIDKQLAAYNQSTSESAATLNAAAGYIKDPTLAGIYRSHAANIQTGGREAGLAYLSQMQNAPAMYGQQQSQQPQQQFDQAAYAP